MEEKEGGIVKGKRGRERERVREENRGETEILRKRMGRRNKRGREKELNKSERRPLLLFIFTQKGNICDQNGQRPCGTENDIFPSMNI